MKVHLKNRGGFQAKVDYFYFWEHEAHLILLFQYSQMAHIWRGHSHLKKCTEKHFLKYVTWDIKGMWEKKWNNIHNNYKIFCGLTYFRNYFWENHFRS